LRNRSGAQINVNIVREATRLLQQQQQSRAVAPSALPATEATTAKVIVSQAGKVIREKRFSDRLLIGRSELNDLCIDNPYLSRHHAVIVRTDRGHYLSDLNSVNGIGLNGQPVHSTPIGDGDVFCIGPYRLKLRLTEPVFIRDGAETPATLLTDTAVMPAAGTEPAHLKVIK
jgi:pSer/pThr/pTyr-binding forkhead associated (FHA) protein